MSPLLRHTNLYKPTIPAILMENIAPTSPARLEKSKINLNSVLKSNDEEAIQKTWQNLLNGRVSKFTSVKKPIIWNRNAYSAKDKEGKIRQCWTVSVSRYGNGFTNSKSIPPYHLALLSKLAGHKDKLAFKEEIKSLASGRMHITHTCGNGRSMAKHDSMICCNPSHLEIRTHEYNMSQVHCHYFLKLADDSRSRFFEANLCQHDPPCF